MQTISIGWDVRGWRGKKQAVAIIETGPGEEIEWLANSSYFQFPDAASLNLDSLLAPCETSASKNGVDLRSRIDESDRIIVAIDAPLSFPQGFRNLLMDPSYMPTPTPSEIENPLAFRDCERWIHARFGKPLSAPFDRLGNNATLAIALCHGLAQDGFAVRPYSTGNESREVLEVYPRTVKVAGKDSQAIPVIAEQIPAELKPNTDKYDAAICAILGLMYRHGVPRLGLPSLVGPPPGAEESEEGWIYAPPSSWVQEQGGAARAAAG